MANSQTANPWVLDTAGVLSTKWTKIQQIELVGYTANADKAVLVDNNGVLIAELTGSADLSTVRTGKIDWVLGLNLQTLALAAGGKVLVYIQ